MERYTLSKQRRKPSSKTTRHARLNDADLRIRKSQIRLLLLLIGAVCVAVGLVHWPVLSAQSLSCDDNMYFQFNPLVQNPSWASARQFLTEVLEPSTVKGYYQPLTMISLMLDWALGARPGNLMPVHLTSLVLHIANTALVIILLYMLFGRPMIAAAVGLLFGLHPMTVELVAWVSDRKDVLASFFTFLALVFYVHFTRKRDRRFYAGSLVIYFLALLSKPTSVPFPILLMLMDFWPLGRFSRKVVLEKVPFFVLAGIFAVITVISQGRSASVVMPTQVSYDLGKIPLIVCHDIVFYLYKIVWPTRLCLFYGFPEPFDFSNSSVLAGVVGTCVLVPLLIISLRRTRVLLTGWLFFFVAVLPTMGLIKFTNMVAADRYAYLPSLGLLMIIAYYLSRLFETAIGPNRNLRIGMIVTAVLVLAGAEARATRRYLAVWKDSVSFYRYVLTVRPDDWQMHKGLAFAYQSAGKTKEAITKYRYALKLVPEDIEAINNLGDVLQSDGKLDQAIEHYRRALEINPDYFLARNNLANILQARGKFDEAVENYLYVLKTDPDNADVHYNLANLLYSRGEADEAIEHYVKALEIRPDDVEARCNLADTLRSQSRFDEAIKHYRDVLKIAGDSIMALNGLAVILTADTNGYYGGPAEAVRLATRAAELTGHRNPVVLSTLAGAYAAAGKLDIAKRMARQALNLASTGPDVELTNQIRRQWQDYSQQKP